MTEEEKTIQDRRVVRTFDVPQTRSLEEKKIRLRKQGDMRERPARKVLTGGVVDVSPQGSSTVNKIVYENMHTETLTPQQLLERVTFFDDPRRAARLRELEAQALAASNWPPQGPVRTARRKRRVTSGRDRGLASSKKAIRDPCGHLTSGQNSEGFLPPTGWSWTRPGLYSEAAPLTQAPQTRGTGRPTGPGLPTGDAAGDYD